MTYMPEHTFTFTDDELQCIRVCMRNAPSPYDISKKKLVEDVVSKIGEPIIEKIEPLSMPKYDLSKYGITD